MTEDVEEYVTKFLQGETPLGRPGNMYGARNLWQGKEFEIFTLILCDERGEIFF